MRDVKLYLLNSSYAVVAEGMYIQIVTIIKFLFSISPCCTPRVVHTTPYGYTCLHIKLYPTCSSVLRRQRKTKVASRALKSWRQCKYILTPPLKYIFISFSCLIFYTYLLLIKAMLSVFILFHGSIIYY